MTLSRDIDLINDLRQLSAETTCMECKKDNIDPESIGKRCSALSNAACIEGKENAYIEDGTHDVKGTQFNPDQYKEGGQEFQLWLAQRLRKEVKNLRMEKEILKKARAFFAKEMK